MKQALIDSQSIPTSDWFPHNFILSGKNLTLIDQDDPTHFDSNGKWGFTPEKLDKILDLMDEEDLRKVQIEGFS